MKIEQYIKQIDDNTVETNVKVFDDEGNPVRELPYTYYEVYGTIMPAYESLIFAMRPYRDCTIEVYTTHFIFRKYLFDINNSESKLSVKLAKLLEENNIELLIGDLIHV